MLTNMMHRVLKVLFSTYVFILIIFSFVGINFIYLWFGGWLASNHLPEKNITLIISLLGSAATTFAAITAAILVLNWKTQHNLSLISKLITEIWDFHSQFTSNIYKLTYTFTIDTKEKEYKEIYSELIQFAVPLRSKAQQLQILLEGQIDKENWEFLQKYLNYLEMFYPWCALEFLEYRDDRYEFLNEFKYANTALMNICKKYISLE